MPNPLYNDEPQTQRELVDWLKANGWVIESSAAAFSQGIDVVAHKDGIKWGFEVKGHHNPRTEFERALGQLLLKINGKAHRYSMVFPNYDEKTVLKLWALVPATIKTDLKVSLLLVEPGAIVREYS